MESENIRKFVKNHFQEIKLYWSEWFTGTIIKEKINLNISNYNNILDFCMAVDQERRRIERKCIEEYFKFSHYISFKSLYNEACSFFEDNQYEIIYLYRKYNDGLGVDDYMLLEIAEITKEFWNYKFKTNLCEIFDPVKYYKEYFEKIPIELIMGNDNVSDDVKQEMLAFCSLL